MERVSGIEKKRIMSKDIFPEDLYAAPEETFDHVIDSLVIK